MSRTARVKTRWRSPRLIFLTSGAFMQRWRQTTICRTSLPFSFVWPNITDLSIGIRSTFYLSLFIYRRAQQTKCSTNSSRFSKSTKKNIRRTNRIVRARVSCPSVPVVPVRAPRPAVLSNRQGRSRWLSKHSTMQRSRGSSQKCRTSASIAELY